MEYFISIISILGVLLIGAMSPGPSFILVARASISQSRSNGFFMALGMGVGGAFFALIVLIGLHSVLQSLPWLYLALKIIGGLYLILLAIHIWQSARKPVTVSKSNALHASSGFRSFCLALVTQISNPKALIVYGSIFAALLPPDLPLTLSIMLPLLVFLIEFCWYAIVVLLLSSEVSYGVYSSYKIVFDRISSAIMAAIGIRLMMTVESDNFF